MTPIFSRTWDIRWPTPKRLVRMLLTAACLSGGSSSIAKTWTDIKGRTFSGLLLHVGDREATFEKYGQGQFAVPLSRLGEQDRSYAEAWRAARPSAVVLSGTVFQAIKTGVLLKGVELRRQGGISEVPKWESKLDRKTVTEKRYVVGWKLYPLPSEHVFVAGLDDVFDKHEARFLVVWPAGFFDYETAGNAARRIQRYELHPPGFRTREKP